MADQKLQVVVIMGGVSPEHDISLQTGKTVMNGLNGYDVNQVFIDKEGFWQVDGQEFDAQAALRLLKSQGTDVAYIALHGRFGEDGQVQALLESADIAYTGSGVEASALAMNKHRSMQVYMEHGLKVPHYVMLIKGKDLSEPFTQAQEQIGFPCIMKPSDGGSSAATFVLKSPAELDTAAKAGFEVSEELVLQEFIQGDEVTCAILDTEDEAIPLPPTQIIPNDREFFDYYAKYQAGASQEITPPKLAEETIKEIQNISLQAHKMLGCSGLSRTDMIVSEKQIYVLETNTVPGMTKTSLYPQAAAKIGLSFGELLDKLIQKALFDKTQRGS